MQMSDGTKVQRMSNGTNNQPVATDNTTGNEAGRAVSSMALTISHLQRRVEWGRGRGDRSNGSRKDEKLVLPTKRTHRLPS